MNRVGDRITKARQLDLFLLRKFRENKVRKMIIHDADLKRWALICSRDLEIKNFKASPSFIRKFKLRNKIRSRKITRYLTKNMSENAVNIQEESEAFVSVHRERIREVGPESYSNSDQSGFNLEFHSGRTLEFSGCTSVEAQVQTLSGLTHSYTIQPTITAAGEMLSPMLLVLKEPGGTFGPQVQKNLFRPPNLEVTASTSGKMTKEIMKVYYEKTYLPQCPAESNLLLDQWGGFDDTSFLEELLEGQDKIVNIYRLPKHSTPITQPCDKMLFRSMKHMTRTIYDRILMDNIEFRIPQRNNILKMASVLHNQFSAPRFKPLIQYAWYACGYLEDRPPPFQTPAEYCLKEDDEECHYCESLGFLRCAWCTKKLCFVHTFSDEHFHYCTEIATE